MKGNRVEHSLKVRIAVAAVALVVLLAAVGAFVGYGRLNSVYREQFRVDDMTTQVTISSGRMVKADVIAECLGIRKGCNLAEIDFAEKRRQILKRIPTLKEIRIVRRLPGQIFISAEERTPVARLNVRGVRGVSGKVVDSEGVVFLCQRGTQMLPVIRESVAKGTQVGDRLDEMPRSALDLLEYVRAPGFTDVSFLEVDASRADFLVATMADYSTVKIRWNGMDRPPTPESRADLKNRIDNLVKAIRSRVTSDVKVWNATMPGLIFADTQEKIQ